jgi:hypothetical protein
MNDQSQNPIPNPSTPPLPQPGWREQRRAEHAARHEARMHQFGSRRHGWTWGVMLILLGVIFLLENMGYKFLKNWPALFIFIPAFWAYAGAWEAIQASGHLTRRAARALTFALLLTILALVLLFELTLGIYWPVLLIVAGAALLLSGALAD